MAVPKKKKSKSNGRMRQAANWKLKAPSASSCPRCGIAKRPHVVCGGCGWYKGRIAVVVDAR